MGRKAKSVDVMVADKDAVVKSSTLHVAKNTPMGKTVDSTHPDMVIESDYDCMSVTTQSSSISQEVEDSNSLAPLNTSLRISDAESDSGALLIPNCLEPYVLDNDVCKGRAILKLRRTPEDATVEPYFKGRKRMYEIQVEGELKNIETERIYVGIQGSGPMPLQGMFSWAAAKCVTALIRSTTTNSHVSLGNKDEVCHISLPLHTTADTFIITKKGDPLPPLGVDEFPQEKAIPRAERAKRIKGHKPGEIYSFSMHGMYLDLEAWRLVNVPKVPPICMARFLGNLPMYFVAYVLPKGYVGPHSEKVKEYLFKFRIEHTEMSKSA
ncbi:hypothetical protein SARC_11198 [Sphaeroforma arctica JP610]|uniref:Domain of unknown function at the cortex 1 domain-containing protein n=1 Tax=Sphaeroforma arctica JP610 TaxID=667725 RepID=A0A0L0FJT5_9EUKA|nr:hypothetical protein SARC_11198 [Sphaeroforma arctica JP610]KNC76293.1 hypothetical protein SARC_11198 [Sphaeroforma arctica JP610]|eukprot:XP_014150195.1 hypothetical protein SARC_11198 [Sphaeroforma arctica JP610]